MSDARLISSLFAARLLRAAATHGLDPRPHLAAIGLTVDSDDFPPIAEAAHLAVWEAIMAELDDPGFPIAYAETMSLDDYGVLGLACKTARDLRASLDVLTTYLPVYADAVEITVERRGRDTAVVIRRPAARSSRRWLSCSPACAPTSAPRSRRSP